MRERQMTLIFTIACLLVSAAIAAPAAAQVGTSFVPFRLQGFTGLDATNLPALLVFYSTTCPVCADFFKAYLPLEKELSGKVRINLVALEKDPETVRKHAEEMKFTVPVLLDPEGRIARAYGGKATPHIVMVDSSGYIQYATSGSLDGGTLRDMVMKVSSNTADSAFKPLFQNKPLPATGGG